MPLNALPTARALQDALLCDLNTLAPFRAFVFGPQAALHRYGQVAEKTAIRLGDYNSLADQNYLWPARKPNSTVDLSYAKLWVENAYLNYFNDYAGSGSTVAPSAGYTNRVSSSTVRFKSFGAFPRDTALLDRDVQVGDIAYVRGTVVGTTYDLWTTVQDFAHDVVGATVAPATADGNNKTTQVASASSVLVAGSPANDIDITVNGTGYDGSVDGYLSRTYTITVTQSSTGGNATTARLSVTSADGGDNVASVTPAAFGSATPIGARGLTVTFNKANDPARQSAATGAGIAADDLVVGQKWNVTVAQAWTAPVATSSGAYTGPGDTTYIIKVATGGINPQVTAATTTGIDSSSAVTVTAANTPVVVGNYGVRIAFSAARLAKGDTYYVAVTSTGSGAIRTLVLANDLPANLQAATDLDLRLFINKPLLKIDKVNDNTGATNWTADQTYVSVKRDIRGFDPTWTSGGQQQALPIYKGTLYAEYREWLGDMSGQVLEFTDVSQVEPVLGSADPDNPIAFGVLKALQNTPGAVLQNALQNPTTINRIRCATLAGDPTDPSLQGWKDILTTITGSDLVYNLVPLTDDQKVHDLVIEHVKAQSDPVVGLRRACLLQARADTTSPVVDQTKTSNQALALATIAQDPGTVTASFTYLRVPAGNAKFVANGVAPGDVVRYQFTTDTYGNPTWNEYVVDQVMSEDSLRLKSGPGAAVTVAQKVEVWRNLSKDQLVDQVNATAAKYASDRVELVWPDKLQVAGVDVPGYFACAALAGLYGAVPSHQSLTNVEVQGFDAIPRSTSYLTQGHLNKLTAGGVKVLAQTPDGLIYVRRDVTTDVSTLQRYESMVRRNVDMVAYSMLRGWSLYFGYCNNTQQTMAAISNSFFTQVAALKALNNIDRLGPPVYSITLSSLQPHPALPDRVQASMILNGPYPLNGIELTITV